MNDSVVLDPISSHQPGQDVITDEVAAILLVILNILTLVLSIPSTVLNGLNVFIFCTMGTLDSVTVSFLSLSIADFTTVLLYSGTSFNQVFIFFGFSWATDISSYVIAVVFSLALDFAAAVTTFIAVQRGLCVALPFLTRYLFNKGRSSIILSLIFLFCLACWLPRTSTFRIVKIPNPSCNGSSVLIITFLDVWKRFDSFYLIFMKTILSFSEYGVMVICAAVIAVGMRSSIKLKTSAVRTGYRNTSTTGQAVRTGYRNTSTTGQASGDHGATIETSTTKTKQGQPPNKIDSKEVLVIKQSLIVVVVNVVCVLPTIIVCIYMFYEPRFEIGAEFNNLYFVVFTVTNISYTINCSATFFIYKTFNRKFKTRLRHLFCDGT